MVTKVMRVRLQVFCLSTTTCYIEIQIDLSAPIGSVDVAGNKDVLVERLSPPL
ncbi:hypothetical protein O9929_16280 [Vibrio lentus]|nr:hypothetical protein [Vibrio lentus]